MAVRRTKQTPGEVEYNTKTVQASSMVQLEQFDNTRITPVGNPQKQLSEKLKSPEEKQYPKGVVKIAEISVKGLPDLDGVTKLYPYVDFQTFSCGRKTLVARTTVNYDYKNENIYLVFDPALTKGKGELTVEVYNAGTNNLIGAASVNIFPAYNQPYQAEKKLLAKKPTGELDPNKVVGKCIFQIVYVDDIDLVKKIEEEDRLNKIQEEQKKKLEEERKKQQDAERRKKLEQEAQRKKEEEKKKQSSVMQPIVQTRDIQDTHQIRKKEEKYGKGVVKFTSISVRDLPKMTRSGVSNPVVRFKLADYSKMTTVGKNSFNYVYNNEKFDLVYDPAQMQGQKEVDVEVWEYISDNDSHLIGVASVDILPSSNRQTQVQLFLQPEQNKDSLSNEEFDKYSLEKDQKLGKVSFWIIYLKGDQWVDLYNKEELQSKQPEVKLVKGRDYTATPAQSDEEKRKAKQNQKFKDHRKQDQDKKDAEREAEEEAQRDREEMERLDREIEKKQADYARKKKFDEEQQKKYLEMRQKMKEQEKIKDEEYLKTIENQLIRKKTQSKILLEPLQTPQEEPQENAQDTLKRQEEEKK
ncbi:MAG: hypothetical protein EZS28_029955, partial [Streblomastix strix]